MIPDAGADQQVGTPYGSSEPGASTAAVVRHEERARVALPVRVRSRVRLVKEVVTEEVTQTFTLRREVLRVEEVPADASGELSWTESLDRDASGPELEIVLHAEQLVASTTVVPTERIRVGTRVTTSDMVVSAELRREQVAVEQHDGHDGHDVREGTAAGGAPTTEETRA